MPSMDHEAPIELFREHPEVVPTLLTRLLHIELPYFSDVRVTDPGTRTLLATGKRSDAAVVLWDGPRPVLAVILEPQGSIDPDKHWSWPKYTSDLHAEMHCTTYLIVLALTRAVARWADQPIPTLQPGRGMGPYVIGPDQLPRLTSAQEASQEPWLSALTALIHANEEHGAQEALVALQGVKQAAGATQALWLFELLRAIMTQDRYRLLEEFVMLSPESYLPKTDFEQRQFDRGLAKGQAKAILNVFEVRSIPVTEEQSARILAERDLATLHRWHSLAIVAKAAAELFT